MTICLFMLLLPTLAASQTGASNSVVPTLMNFHGTITDASGKPVSGVQGVTFFLYKDSEGGAPLWMETQNVRPDRNGRYSVTLGSATSGGLPTALFTSGDAQWLGVQPQGQAEQPRVLLLSVPYALKAGDAQTIGGLLPSAFMLAPPQSGNTAPNAQNNGTHVGTTAAVVGSGTTDFIPLWTSNSILGNSVLFQSTGLNVGINTTTPAATLDVNGSLISRGALQLPSLGTASASMGFNSQPLLMQGSSFNSSTKTAISPLFQWQTEPSGNNTSTPAGTLNLLYGTGSGSPVETGLNIASNGQITFARNQAFPGAGTITGITTATGSGLTGGGTTGSLSLSLINSCSKTQILQWNGSTWTCASVGTGTVTSVALGAPATDFAVSGSPVTGAGTLNFAWNVAPTDADTANAIVKRDAAGSFTATNINASGTLSATTGNVNAIVGTTSLDGGSAIVGYATATGGNNRVYGVTGNSVSTVAGSTGVLGQDGNTNASEMGGFTMGVQGFSSNLVDGIGVFGLDGSGLSSTFNFIRASFYGGVGAWGDGGAGSILPGIGVVGTMDDGIGGYFVNDSASSYDALDAWSLGGTGNAFIAGDFNSGASCNIDRAGNLNCTGSKNAIVPIDGGKRTVAMSAIEAPQNWFEDAGEAQLVNGAAAVQLDSIYTQTVNSDVKYQVFLTPYGDCKGLYVSNRTATSFEVRELGGGTATLNFGYRIMALRKNYETVRFADHTHDLDGAKKMRERMIARMRVQPQLKH